MKIDWKEKKTRRALGLAAIVAAGLYLSLTIAAALMECIEAGNCPGAERWRYSDSLPVDLAGPERDRAEKGDPVAQYLVGEAYYTGSGVQKDRVEGDKWFARALPGLRKAGERGSVEAQRDLGNICKNGWGTKQDYAEAIKWFRMVADRGDYRASQDLSRLYGDSSNPGRDYGEAYFLAYQADLELCDLTSCEAMRTPQFSIESDIRDAASHLSLEQISLLDKRVAEWHKGHPHPAETLHSP